MSHLRDPQGRSLMRANRQGKETFVSPGLSGTITGEHVGQLRRILESDAQCQRWFAEVVALWDSLYIKDRDQFRLPNLCTGHGAQHFQRVEEFLDGLIFC